MNKLFQRFYSFASSSYQFPLRMSSLPFNSLKSNFSFFRPISLFAFASSVAYYYSLSNQPEEVQNLRLFLGEDFKRVRLDVKASDIPEGGMKAVEFGPLIHDIVLLSKHEGEIYATGAKCPHAGVRLDKGIRFEEKLYCPLHNAAFNIKDGLPDQGPVFEKLPTYKIKYDDKGYISIMVPRLRPLGEPLVRVRTDQEGSTKMNMEHDLGYGPDKRFVIIGSGPAALSALLTLVRMGCPYPITLITKDGELPYDRTKLSKDIESTKYEDIFYYNSSFYMSLGVKFMKSTSVKYMGSSSLETQDNHKIAFTRALVAVGAIPKIPSIPGVKLPNVFTLRTYQDHSKIHEKYKKCKNIVIIGSSFIGMEMAATLKKTLGDKANVTIVDRNPTPYYKSFGQEVGSIMKKFQEQHGIKFMNKEEITSINGDDEAKSVTLKSGQQLPCDMVLLGTGVQQVNSIIGGEMGGLGGCSTDIYMQSSKNTFAAGDCTEYPYWYTGDRIQCEHYNTAIETGQVAAYNMLEKKVPMTSIPFFWTRMWGESLKFVGTKKGYDNIHIVGDPEKFKFIAYYSRRDMIIGVASMGVELVSPVINQAMLLNVMPTLSELREKNVQIEDIQRMILSKKGKNKCKRSICEKTKPKVPPGIDQYRGKALF